MAAPFPSPTKKWHDNTYPSLSPSRPELSAKGKTIVITGGGTGIGAETARHFAEAGASRIALLGRREQPLLDTKKSIEDKFANVKVFTASTDITKKDQVQAAFQSFLGTEGKIDVLVSNAAVTGPMEKIADVDPDAYARGIETNVRGSLNVAQVFLNHAAPDAVVIDINSAAAHAAFLAGFSCYSISKLGVYRLWKSVELSNPELRIYHVQPGVVDTDMNKAAGGVKAMGFEDHVSLPASFNVWLASPEAAFAKGKFLWANWDVDELKANAEEIQNTTKYDIVLGGWPFGVKWDFQPSADAGEGNPFLQ